MLKQYVCHKRVKAGKIAMLDWVHLAVRLEGDSDSDLIFPGAGYFMKHQPEVGGYFVEYDDGYKSFSPAKAFEDGYTLVEKQ